MGCYDTIDVYQGCPHCGKFQLFDAQTKDLGSMMFHYHTYEKDTLLDRSKLPVFKKTPSDRSYKLWKSQDERKKEEARIPDEYNKLKFIDVIADCNSIECQFVSDREDIIRQGSPSGFGRSFDGKILIKDGMLVGKIIDIKKDRVSEKALDKWKEKNPKKYARLMKKFKHEPIAARKWNGVK